MRVCAELYVCVCVCVRYFLAFVYICVLGFMYLYAYVCALMHVCVSEGIYLPLCVYVYRSGDSLERGAHLPPSLRQGLVLLATAHAAALQASRDAGVCLHCQRRNAGMADVCFPVSAGHCSGDLTQVLRLEPPPYAKRGFRMVVLCPVLSNMEHMREIR